MYIEYYSNNSGGYDWLGAKEWKALVAAGWEIREPFSEYEFVWRPKTSRKKNYRYARKNFIDTDISEEVAIAWAKADFENITGQWTEEEGCPCCGPPHDFYRLREK